MVIGVCCCNVGGNKSKQIRPKRQLSGACCVCVTHTLRMFAQKHKPSRGMCSVLLLLMLAIKL